MTDVDVFLCGGQSNMVGDGDSTDSPTPTSGTSWYYTNANGGSLTETADPVQNVRSSQDNGTYDASTGSLLPQFAITYKNHTGRNTLFVQAAVGGSEQCQEIASDSLHWDSGGDLYSESVTFLNDAISYAEGQGYNTTFKGILWLQGESDGGAINSGSLTQSAYRTAYEEMISRYRSDFRSDLPFFCIEVGDKTTESYPEIRSVQDDVALTQKHTHIVSDKQKDYPEKGLMTNGSHYNQTGYNKTGEVAALNTAEYLYGRVFQHKRGTAEDNDSYIGEDGELTVSTDTKRVRIHDGSTQGGSGAVPRYNEV